ncbi:MAG TPA: hypothetical protein PLM09_11870 [Casimicrobiaceae bacterium]|nr:hypothetical protein [Casimicrobiaceae bacterium]
MGVLDEHNRQHTYGNSLGPPTSVVGVSAQAAIDANRRRSDEGGNSGSSGAALRWRDHLKIALWALVIAALIALAAYFVGGIGAVALGLVAFVAGLIGISFLVAALVSALASGRG